jgi:DNA-binding transcriptional ArsR family regulator
MVYHRKTTLDHTFGALADPTRRSILASLTAGDRCVTDLARPFAMSLPAISKHLRVLEQAGLVRRERHGRTHRVRLAAAPMHEAARWIEDYRRFWEGSLDALAHYLENTNKQMTKQAKL